MRTLLLALLAVTIVLPSDAHASSTTLAGDDVLPSAAADGPVVVNPGFECGEGYHAQVGVNGWAPNGWTAVLAGYGTPYVSSTQMWGLNGGCDPNEPWWKWEKIEGYDSLMIMGGYATPGNDFPSPPFDATVYQTVSVTPGVEYSLSAWMVSLCGGSAMPSDCPAGHYIAKMVGLDPTGNIGVGAATVRWLEDRRPHYESRWVDFSPAVKAEGPALTIFLRVRSPFLHHGNHAFADGVALVRAPSAQMDEPRHIGDTIELTWTGSLGPDIPTIPEGKYQLSFNVEYKTGKMQNWSRWQTGTLSTTGTFDASGSCSDNSYRFRVQARAEQPAGSGGAWPPHRFEGLWVESKPVFVPQAFDCPFSAFLPAVLRQ